MNLLVTGGNGFVMTNFLRYWLKANPASHAVVLDRQLSDDLRTSFLGEVTDRIEPICADIASPDDWSRIGSLRDIDAIVHGAAVTPHPYVDASGFGRDPEREDPRKVVDVNIGGTQAALDFARHHGGIRRFVNISSCAVYGRARPAYVHRQICEDDAPLPEALYGIAKFAAEMIVRRYAELYGLSAVSIRLGPIFGPLDRPGEDRNVRDVPNQVASLVAAREQLRVHAFDGVGDWLHAEDAAAAISKVLEAAELRHEVYNLSSGAAATVTSLIDIAAELMPVKLGCTGDANVRCDPDRRSSEWRGYAIDRIQDEFGWSPRPLRQSFQDYIRWLASTIATPHS